MKKPYNPKCRTPLVRPGGLIVAHNMASSTPDPRYVEAVTASPAAETVFLNMHDAGVGVTLKKIQAPFGKARCRTPAAPDTWRLRPPACHGRIRRSRLVTHCGKWN